MSEVHLAYLNLGSNIQPETNLPKAVELLSHHGEITTLSNVWESEAVGTQGPNYLNVCLCFRSEYLVWELKDKVIHPIEESLGRKRSQDKFAARTMDIDIVLFDDQPVNEAIWELAYIVIPLAEIHPGYQIPGSGKSIGEIATRLRREVWLEMRRGVLG
ncbi:MAG TPA: 2-amino-4-hydroxy-6-hydroxymethyldihydropteridine diphosphokinase [Anaerolineales bacterium]|nr:2-amino-4-hydroxy-6-hydroxymethyldihydropteridine diphosphokinase [Anaerolineales bacterium]